LGLFVLFVLLLLAGFMPDFMPTAMSLSRYAPDLWLLTVLYLAFRSRGYYAVPWAIGIGLVRDSLSLDPLGTHGFVLGCIALFFAEGRAHRGPVRGGSRLLLTAVATVIAGWLYLVRILPLGDSGVSFGAFLEPFPVALWTTLLSIGLFPLLDRYRLLDDVCGRGGGHALPA